jgi:predicted RNase H-like nuclease (RuvC/YqgF family)
MSPVVFDGHGNIDFEPDIDPDPYGVFALGEENRKLKAKIKKLTKKNKELREELKQVVKTL